jgi:hypothetical protein
MEESKVSLTDALKLIESAVKLVEPFYASRFRICEKIEEDYNRQIRTLKGQQCIYTAIIGLLFRYEGEAMKRVMNRIAESTDDSSIQAIGILKLIEAGSCKFPRQ